MGMLNGVWRTVAEVASQTQDISLLIAASGSRGSLSSSALDLDCLDQKDVFGLSSDYIISKERKVEAQATLAAVKRLPESGPTKHSVRLAKAFVQFALKDYQACLDTLASCDFDDSGESTHQQLPTSFTAPGSAAGSLGPSSGATTLESALSHTGTLAGGIGVPNLAKRLEVEVGEGRVWATLERIRGRCLEGEYT